MLTNSLLNKPKLLQDGFTHIFGQAFEFNTLPLMYNLISKYNGIIFFTAGAHFQLNFPQEVNKKW